MTDDIEVPPGTKMIASATGAVRLPVQLSARPERDEWRQTWVCPMAERESGNHTSCRCPCRLHRLVSGTGSDNRCCTRVVTIKPISTTAGQPRTVPLPHSNSKRASYDLNLRFRFRIDSMRTAETMFHVGSAKTGVTASISEPVDGYRYVVLSAPRFSAVLVNHVVAGQTYAVTVSIDDGGTSITATVDGQRPFSYNYLASVLPALNSATIGGPVNAPANHGNVKSPHESPLSGSVYGFTLTSRELMPAGSGSVISALRILAGVAVFAAIVLAALRIATGSQVARRVGISARSKHEPPAWFRLAMKYGGKVGIVLLVTGIAILATVTPLDNAVVQQSGWQHLAASDVGPNQKTTYALFGEPKLFANAAVRRRPSRNSRCGLRARFHSEVA